MKIIILIMHYISFVGTKLTYRTMTGTLAVFLDAIGLNYAQTFFDDYYKKIVTACPDSR